MAIKSFIVPAPGVHVDRTTYDYFLGKSVPLQEQSEAVFLVVCDPSVNEL